MENATTELVTIGLPVYNGAEFLKVALDSLLTQSYTNIRLVISDNASTDSTGAICKRYAKKDKRVTYIRQPKNLGPFRNFTSLLTYAQQTEYFMWAAHDDVWAKDYIEACVGALRREPSAIMAFPRLVNIDGKGDIVRRYEPKKMFPTHRPASYIQLFCQDGKANLIYGIWRADMLTDVKMQNHWGSDMNLVFELLLKGNFSFVNKQLFFKRLSPQEMFVSTPPSGLRKQVRFHLARRKNVFNDARPYFAHLRLSLRDIPGKPIAHLACSLMILYAMARTLVLGKV